VSIYYLIDLFTDQINAVVTSQSTPPTILTTGSYVVRVDDNVAVQSPSDLSDLLTKKYLGILGAHGLFTQITYDTMQDASNIDLSNSIGVITGDRGVNGLYANPPAPGLASVLQTTPNGITWTGPGAGPPEATVSYELFTYVDLDPSGTPYQRQYQELSPDVDVSAEISFDNGTSFLSFQDKSLITVPTSSRGVNIILRFTRETDVSAHPRVFIGSWAVLY
jgi:hypothetical protein